MAIRETIILHSQHLKNLDKLTDDQAGRLLKSLYALMLEKEPLEMDAVTDMLFSIMKDWTLNNWALYDKSKEAKREAGRKGGLAKASTSKQNVAEVSSATFATAKHSNAKHNVNVNDNVNENVNVNDDDNRNDWTLPYGTFLNVMITANEYEQLCNSWRKEQVDEKIEHLSSYLKQGHDYSNHYVTLHDWLKKDYPEQKKTIGNDLMKLAEKMLSEPKIKIASNE